MTCSSRAQTRFRLPLVLSALFIACLVSVTAHAQDSRRPNIVVVLLDNLGWGELGSYGGGALRGAPTPQLDALAGQGLRLTNFNVEASCTPTRSALLTGRFSVRSGTLRSGASGLVNWEVTVAQLLKQKGYATAHIGKWHLGDEQGRYPNDFGFDEWYGIPRTSNEALNETSPGYDPAVTEPMYIMEGKAGGQSSRVKVYDMDARRNIDGDLVDRTITFIRRNAGSRTPFLAYVPLTQVHFPTVPSAAFAGRSGYGDFADSMMQTDFLIGKLVAAVDDIGIAKDTLIIVASDNGPEYRRPWRGTAGYWAGTYHTMMEGGLRAPAIIRWTGRIQPRVSDGIVHAVDVFNTLARAGGAEVPTDRPIDGVNQLDFLTGASSTSAREGFPAFIEGELFGVKFRDWKYHMIWRPDPEKPIQRLERPYLFNVSVDPKEESPRALQGDRPMLEDGWVLGRIRRIIRDTQDSLAAFPAVPFGAPRTYVPKPAPPKP